MDINSLNLSSNGLPKDKWQADIPVSQSFTSSENDTSTEKVDGLDTFNKTDRRQQNLSVDIDRRSGLDRRSLEREATEENITKPNSVEGFIESIKQGTDEVNSKIGKFDNYLTDNKDNIQKNLALCGVLVPFRRLSVLPGKIEDKDYLGTAEALAVTAILMPEDLRDTQKAVRQVLSENLSQETKDKIKNKSEKLFKNWVDYAPDYDCADYQHDFSFIKGSLIEKPINKCENKFGYLLHKYDKSINQTSFGKKIFKALNIDGNEYIFTGNKATQILEVDNNYLKMGVDQIAVKLEGAPLKRLLAKSMQRTTLYGLVASAAICLPSIVRAFIKPDTTKDKIENGCKQTLKSAVGIASATSCIGLVGSYFSKYGAKGSVGGMALGAALGLSLASKINKKIETV